MKCKAEVDHASLKERRWVLISLS